MRVCAEVAAALAAAHAEGLVHRDIKPANVMVTPDGVKVVDFGVAAAISPSTRGGRADEVFGTPAYLAPERLIDDAVAPASDVYALGVLAYRMLSGHSPWDVETTTQMLTAHVYVEPEPLTSLPDVPDYVIDLINRCLAKDPTMRPSARDAAELLAKGAEMKVVAEAPATPGPAIDDQPSVVLAPFTAALAAAGNRLLWLVTAGVVVLAVLLWQVWPSGHSSHVAEGPPPAVPVPSATTGGQAQYVLDPSPTPALTTTHGKPPATATKPGESTPTAVPAPPTTGPAALSPSSPGVTFTSVGGIVRAACTAPATVHLESFVPTTGWKITVVNPGPRKQAAIIFKKGKQRVVQAYTCKKSIPSVQSVQS
jgi:serine/threonine-protein kinase